MTKSEKRETIAFYTLISPFILMFLFLKVVPIINGVYLSMTNYNGFNYNKVKFTGAVNYLKTLTDNVAMYAVYRTFLITMISVPLSLILGILLAMLLNNKMTGISIYRTVFYIPSIVPAVAAGTMWMWIYNKSEGLLNVILGGLGVPPVNWLGYDMITTSLILLLLWGAGGNILINLSALKSVPTELYESAEIDGASGFRKFAHITFPMITPIIYYNLVVGVIWSLQLFAQPAILAVNVSAAYGITNVPLKPTYTVLVHIYQQLFVNQRFGYGLAIVWCFFAIIMIFTFIIRKTSKYWVYYEVSQDGG